MSVVDQRNVKVLLPRTGADEFWQTISDGFADADARRWKYLAMLALRENAGWSLEQIAKAFRHQPGHVCRCIENIKAEVREYFFNAPTDEEERIEDGG